MQEIFQKLSVHPAVYGCPLFKAGKGQGGDWHWPVIHAGNWWYVSILGNNRWHSDTNIALNPEQDSSSLTVDKTEYDLHNGSGLLIHWDIKENVSAKDWIGLYKLGEYLLLAWAYSVISQSICCHWVTKCKRYAELPTFPILVLRPFYHMAIYFLWGCFAQCGRNPMLAVV